MLNPHAKPTPFHCVSSIAPTEILATKSGATCAPRSDHVRFGLKSSNFLKLGYFLELIFVMGFHQI